MKLAFSTLSCPEWSFDQILEAAKQYGYDGIEFRGIMDEIDLPEVPEFLPAHIAGTRRKLEHAGVQAVCLSASTSVVALTASEIDRQTAVTHAQRYVELAQQVGAPFVRLFCGGIPPGLARSTALERAADTLRRIGDFAQPRGVTAVVETHDDFVSTQALVALIRLATHPAVRILWDIHHPYRLMNETIEQSLQHLNGYVYHTHVKDSIPTLGDEGYSYVLLGEGDVPVLAAMRGLQHAGYAGYFSLEWEKRWIPELQGPGVVLPQFVQQMRAWEKELG